MNWLKHTRKICNNDYAFAYQNAWHCLLLILGICSTLFTCSYTKVVERAIA